MIGTNFVSFWILQLRICVKINNCLYVWVVGLNLLSDSAFSAESRNDIAVASLNVAGHQATLSWNGGRPSYQVQVRSNLTADWVNFGAPTSDNFAVVPISTEQAYFRVVSDFTARYEVVFNATWSQATHPEHWPAGAHFSGLVGGTHNAKVHFWREGGPASEGIRLMAESGQKTTLLSEIAPAIANGTADLQLSGGGISPSPGDVKLIFPKPMRRDFPLVTLVSMIAPSPDWFVGVDSLDLIEDGQWVRSKTVTLYGMDAGTDSGATYVSPDQATVPRDMINTFTGFPALVNGSIVPFGTFTFTRLD
jgi:hypothetical protein